MVPPSTRYELKGNAGTNEAGDKVGKYGPLRKWLILKGWYIRESIPHRLIKMQEGKGKRKKNTRRRSRHFPLPTNFFLFYLRPITLFFQMSQLLRMFEQSFPFWRYHSPPKFNTEHSIGIRIKSQIFGHTCKRRQVALLTWLLVEVGQGIAKYLPWDKANSGLQHHRHKFFFHFLLFFFHFLLVSETW